LTEPDTATTRVKPPSSRAHRGAAPSSGLGTANESTTAAPGVKELVRALVAAEKSYQVDPGRGKVAQQSISGFEVALKAFHEGAHAPLELEVSPSELLHDGEIVHSEETRAKGLAHRLHRDSIRRIVFRENVTAKEISDFLSCFRETRRSDGSGADFGAIFWEKDIAGIQVFPAGELGAEDATQYVPVSREAPRPTEERFRLGAAEEARARELIASRLARRPGHERALLLTATEEQHLRALAREEETRSPLEDFVDILLELTAREARDPRGIDPALQRIRGVIVSFIESFDFAAARDLIARLREAKRQGIAESFRHGLGDLLRGLADKSTMHALSTFLRESPQLPVEHEVFGLMKELGQEALPHYCKLLTLHQHSEGIASVLIQVGAGCGDILSQYLTNPDTHVVRMIIQVILKAGGQGAAAQIAPALKHADESIRLHAAKLLLEHGDATAAPVFAHIVKEASKELLPFGIQFFSRVPFLDVYDDMEGLIRSKRFHELDGQRQDQCFQGLVLSNPSRAMDFISDAVLRWSFWGGERAVRKQTAALRSLALHPHARAIAILREVAQRGRGPLAPVATRVLDIIERSSACVVPGLLEVRNV
jgi:hypothetical protein